MRKKETPNPSRVRGRGVEVSETLFYAGNELKSVIARKFGDCSDSQRDSFYHKKYSSRQELDDSTDSD